MEFITSIAPELLCILFIYLAVLIIARKKFSEIKAMQIRIWSGFFVMWAIIAVCGHALIQKPSSKEDSAHTPGTGVSQAIEISGTAAAT